MSINSVSSSATTTGFAGNSIAVHKGYKSLYTSVDQTSAVDHKFSIELNNSGAVDRTATDDGKVYANYRFASAGTVVPTVGGSEETAAIQSHGHRFHGKVICVNDFCVLGTTSIAGGLDITELDLSGTLDVEGATNLAVTNINDDFAVQTDNLVVTSSNGFVGIGKTTPTVALDVVGAFNVTGDVTLSAGNLDVSSGAINMASASSGIQLTDCNVETTNGNLVLNGTGALNIEGTGNIKAIDAELRVGSLNAGSTGTDTEITYIADTGAIGRSRADHGNNGTITVNQMVNLMFDLQARLDLLTDSVADE